MNSIINIQYFEDPKRPFLGPNVWMLETIGMILPKNKLGRLASVFFLETATFFVVSQYIELYAIRADLNQVLINTKISLLSTVIIVKSNSCLYWQKNFVELVDYITVADIEERNDSNTRRRKIIDSYTKYSRTITFLYFLMVLTTAVLVIMTPVIIYLTETYIYKNRAVTDKFEHIVSAWMPFDKNTSPGCWLTVVWQVIICLYGSSIMVAFDVTAIVMMVFFGAKLELLRERCATMNLESNLSEDESNTMFRKMHYTHSQIIKYSRMLNLLLSPVMFIYIIICSFMLSISAYQYTSATTVVEKFLMAEYVVFAVAQLFMFCWHSNDVLFKSQHVMQGPYESNWWNSSIKHCRCVLLLSGKMKENIIFTAGPFTNLTLSTFITIIKGAYSYYTLLRK